MNMNKYFHAVEHYFFSLVSQEQIDYGSLIAFTTGVFASGLNPAIVQRYDHMLLDKIKKVIHHYQTKNIPWALVVPDYLHPNTLQAKLSQEGLKWTGDGVAMGVLLSEFDHSLTNTMQIREMRDDMHTWHIPLVQAFGASPETPDLYIKRHHEAIKKGEIYHFSAFIDNTVVSSLTLSCCGAHARIDDVATLPTHQKRGFASDLMTFALKFAKQLGKEDCFLEASPDGLSLYRRLGFLELFKNHYYEIQDLS